jgi:hypothetical protein
VEKLNENQCPRISGALNSFAVLTVLQFGMWGRKLTTYFDNFLEKMAREPYLQVCENLRLQEWQG